jgi:hypothetical protein
MTTEAEQQAEQLEPAIAEEVPSGDPQLPNSTEGEKKEAHFVESVATSGAAKPHPQPSASKSGDTGKIPKLPQLLLPSQLAPFQSSASDSDNTKADSVTLTGYEVPRHASPPTLKSTALYFSGTDSEGVLLRPTPSPPQGEEELDEMKLIKAFQDALSKACEAGKAMQPSSEKRKGGGNTPMEENAASRDFTKQYEELVKYEQHLKEAYERECSQLKEELQSMEVKQRETKRDHEIEVVKLVREHCEEKQKLKDKMDEQLECLEFQNLQQKQSDVAKLKKWKKTYREEYEEVSTLCQKLAEKEKKLHHLQCAIEQMETSLRKHLLTTNKEHIRQQLKTCEQIRKMVERLPNMSSGGEMEKTVGEIAAQVEKMRSLSTNKRSTSWRR